MLTDAACRNAKPREKAYKLADGESLYLFVSVTGVRSWRWKYRFAGKEKLLTIGTYPTVSLGAARKARDRARSALEEGLAQQAVVWSDARLSRTAVGRIRLHPPSPFGQ